MLSISKYYLLFVVQGIYRSNERIEFSYNLNATLYHLHSRYISNLRRRLQIYLHLWNHKLDHIDTL